MLRIPNIEHFKSVHFFTLIITLFNLFSELQIISNVSANDCGNRNEFAGSGWKLYFLFVDAGCTIHFSIREIQPWSPIHDSVLHFCQDSNLLPGCVLFQTHTSHHLNSTLGYGRDNVPVKSPTNLMTDRDFYYWKESAYENWNLVNFLFEKQKFKPTCRVQLGVATSEINLQGILSGRREGSVLAYIPEPGWWDGRFSSLYKYPES